MVTNELIKSPNSNAKILEPAGWKPMVHLLTELLLEAQRYVRKVEDLRSATSLRDVRRCLLLIQWFATKPDPVYILSRLDSSVVQNDDDDDGDSTGGGIKENLEDLSEKRLEAVILAVAHVYYYRLADLNIRSAFWNKVSRIFSRDPRWRNIFDAKGCEMLLFQEQTKYCSQMELEKGIALNDALRENLFVMMVSIFNRIPVFVVGKPGSSKSLAMQIISNNLRGASSPKRFWREFPAIHVVPYQCSPLSTSESIRYQWNKARSYQKKQKKVITVLLLDEVGLAELSPDMPLKVLHEVLTNNEVGIVGISNWVRVFGLFYFPLYLLFIFDTHTCIL
jgi:E3 ubiquitin-protein ligase RNF213